MKSENFSDPPDSNATTMFKAQKGSKDIVKSPCVISGSTVILWSYKNTFCVQR